MSCCAFIKKSALLALVLLSVSGCGHPIERRLEGRWLGADVENISEDRIAQAVGWIRGTSLEFSGSTLTVTIPAEDPRSAPYKVVSAHEGRVKLAVLADEKHSDTLELILDTHDSLRWRLNNGAMAVLKREN
jgi:hypothetical protein